MTQRIVKRETEVTIIICDICGGEPNMARYAENRRCHNCGRDVCNNCQTIMEHCTECKICTELGVKWWPKINKAYDVYEHQKEMFKAASLAVAIGETGKGGGEG